MNIVRLCDSLVELAKERCSQLTPDAEVISKTFNKAFSLFADCHAIYDSSRALSQADIHDLSKKSIQSINTEVITIMFLIESRIEKFLGFYHR